MKKEIAFSLIFAVIVFTKHILQVLLPFLEDMRFNTWNISTLAQTIVYIFFTTLLWFAQIAQKTMLFSRFHCK
jgi:hypothetical protein